MFSAVSCLRAKIYNPDNQYTGKKRTAWDK